MVWIAATRPCRLRPERAWRSPAAVCQRVSMSCRQTEIINFRIRHSKDVVLALAHRHPIDVGERIQAEVQ